MRKGYVFVYYGEGRGKTTLSIGQGIRAIGEGLKVVMIKFLDYYNNKEIIPLKKLEPDFRVFRFEKARQLGEQSDCNKQKEISSEIRMAFQFTKKIIETGECDTLILDGILEAVEHGYITEIELGEIMLKRPSYMDIIVTGKNNCEPFISKADYIYTIKTEKRPEVN